MKKKVFICVSLTLLFLVSMTSFILLSKTNKTRPFYLENKYYNSNGMNEITYDELSDLTDDKKSFVVFVYQPMCITSSNFENVLNDFLKENQISIYKIAFSNIKDTSLGTKIKYYPSFIIYKNGKIVDFLEADKDEDVDIYTKKDSFTSWFTKYVKLRNNSTNKNNTSDEKLKNEEKNHTLVDVNLDNIKREENKVNIYFFWGDGCPHCEEEIAFFESIKETYGDYYNLYTFETWYNEENVRLAFTFAENMGDTITGVPYTIIGNKSFKGFKEKYKNEIIDAIENEHTNAFDVYFDKIKK